MAALSTTALLALSAAKTVADVSNQRAAARTAEREGQYARAISEMNAGVLDRQAADAIARGAEAESLHRRGVRQLVGTQRTNLAAQGIAIDEGTALDIQAETAELGELDALTIRNNAAREALGFQAEAAITRHGGMLAAKAGKQQAKALRNQSWGTLLMGGLEMAGAFGQYRTAKPRKPVPGTSGKY